MHGRRSRGECLEPLDPEIERSFQARRALFRVIGQPILSKMNPEDVLPIVAQNEARPLKDHFIPTSYTNPSCIQWPATEVRPFEIKSGTIQMLPSFFGLSTEDPYKHLNEFHELCDTVKLQQLSDDALRLRLFPFSLKDKAKYWLHSLEPNSITTWNQLQQAFIQKYYPIGKTTQMRAALMNFSHTDGEQFFESWERFKDLIRKCPHHGIEKWYLVQSFYHGISKDHRNMVDNASGGAFLNKTDKEAWDLFETLSENSAHHATASRVSSVFPNNPKKGGIYEIGHAVNVQDQVAALSRKLDQFLSMGQSSTTSSNQEVACLLCACPTHFIADCPLAPQYPEFVQEQVNSLQGVSRPGNDPFSNTYNPGWRNHPNFSWKQQAPNNSYSQNPRPYAPNTFNPSQYRPPQNQYQQPPPPPPRNSPFEEKVLSTLQFLEANLKSNSQLLNSHTQSIAKLETQLGQLAQAVGKRDEGKLPSQPINNPKGQYEVEELNFQQAKAITTLRSGREVDNKVEMPKEIESNDSSHSQTKAPGKQDTQSCKAHNDPSPVPYQPKAPFPQCLAEPSPFGKKGATMEEMLEIFKQVKINLPLLEAVKQIPSYAKFLKDLCTQKRKSKTHVSKKIFLTEQISSIIQHQTPPKFKDPGAPTISCTIGDHTIEQALLDLGASVNLLPYSVYEQFGLGELKPTTVSLQLADRSVKIPRGIIEDVLVKVDKFFFPVDFLVLDMEHVPDSKCHTPVILGRPFLATANACINCRTGVMDLSFGNMTMRLNVFHDAQQPPHLENCFALDEIEDLTETSLPQLLVDDPLERCLSHFDTDSFDIDNFVEEVSSMLDFPAYQDYSFWKSKPEPLPNLAITPAPPSLEVPPKLELKPLPASLKYSFLGPDDTLPVIIASNLSSDHESRLLDVLSEHKSAIGWSVADLKGIDPSICMHRIHLEDNAKPSREMERRLNPNMKEVVMKEVVKLLDAGIIYPISDSKWVSPTQVVPKKSGVIVVESDQGELVPTRITTGWRVCIDYRKLNSMTRKDHFPLPFIDQILERLAGQSYYCFLDGYSGYNQIAVFPDDQEKTTFTCPFGTYAYHRMPFGLCNAPATFQRCMMSIFSDMVEKFLEVFMDDGVEENCVVEEIVLVDPVYID